MAAPRGANTKATNGVRERRPCVTCGVPKVLADFYLSESPLHIKDGKIPTCKSCLSAMFDINNPEESLKNILRQIDKPFFYDVFETSALENPDNIYGKYMKNIIMPQYRGKGYTWENSVFSPADKENVKFDNFDNNKNVTTISGNYPLSDALINKWGDGYTPEEYHSFEKKWTKLIDNYGEKTALHTEGLITYIRFRTKEEMATAKNNTKDAKDWAALANAAATSAKLNVSQLSKSDISGGVDLMSQLYEAVETEVGIIPLLPKLTEQPYDDADMIIWSIVNYTRRLEDKPPVPYKDIWNFYDDMLGEHFSQQNYNEDQIKEFKEKRINIFRDLSEIYKEPLYESED